MNVLATISLVTLFVVVSFGPPIAGAVIARRAWNRNGWPEARLAFRAFMAGPVIIVISAIAYPLTAWLTDPFSTFDLLSLFSMIAGVAVAVQTTLIAIALYRLAGRSARRGHGDADGDLRGSMTSAASVGPGFAHPDIR